MLRFALPGPRGRDIRPMFHTEDAPLLHGPRLTEKRQPFARQALVVRSPLESPSASINSSTVSGMSPVA